MSQPPAPGGRMKPGITPGRVATWVLVVGVGAYLLVSGVVGIIAKG